MARAPKIVEVGTKAQFRRAVSKSYSYRYEVATPDADGAPRVNAVIETRYRGKSATWYLSRSMLSAERWPLNGTFVEPAPEHPLAYPPKPAGPSASANPPAATPSPAPAPAPAPSTRPRADPAG